MVNKRDFFEAFIRFQSYNSSSLYLLNDKLRIFADEKKLYFSSINLPVVKKKITVLKSPHVNKKARDQFEVVLFNRLVVLKSKNVFLFDGLHDVILGEGVSAKIVLKNV